MGFRENKITVRIKDFVDGREGTFLGWKNATHKMPSGQNEKGYQMYYYPDSEGTNSIIVKLTAIFSKLVFKGSREKAVGMTPIKLTKKVYPESGIEGFDGGTTFNNPDSAEDVPDKFVVLHEDSQERSKFIDEFGPGNENYAEKYRKEKNKRKDLEQKLEAVDVEISELEDKVGDDDDDKNSRRANDLPPGMFNDEEGMMDQGGMR